MSNMVETKELIFEYTSNEKEKVIAVSNLSLDIKNGEFVAVLGHNGSGKSTLAKLINAILVPSGGKVYVNSMDTSDIEKLWEIRQCAGMVFQNPDNQIVATLVEEDVAFGPENLGIISDEIRERVDESLKAVGIYELKSKPPHLLSGGQKQRVAIAGVLAMRPRCIIFDEPTAMLDPSGRKEVMDAIMKLNREGITIIHITHFMDEAVNADRVIVMEDGKVALSGEPKQVFSKVEELKNLGLDVPQVTLLSYELNRAGVKLSEDILTVDEMVMELCQLL
ncbi:energy-coupling factor transporter ATPase [Wukongibacter sp. M2B1]|uniref:energy-coupling factor transporter ATPase n=1 Tax=Wukongibacter sp. M2B1 TaxID=3088895 RepID=UPI003D7B7E2E